MSIATHFKNNSYINKDTYTDISFPNIYDSKNKLKDYDIYEDYINQEELSTSKDIVDKIEERIAFLESVGLKDNLNKTNMKLSEKSMRDFFDMVVFKKYYSILLDDNGYFNLRMKDNDYLVLLLFKKNIHFYVYHPSRCRYLDEVHNEITEMAFYLRENKKSLSCYLAEFYKQGSKEENIKLSMKKFKSRPDFTVRNNDVFAVLDVKSIRNKASDLIDKILQENRNDSHVGIYFDSNKNFEVAMILACIANKNGARK